MSSDAVISLLVSMLACAAAATPGLFFRPGKWYRQLVKPSWRPPDWLFGPVWLVLYISIAVSGWLVWLEPRSEEATRALIIYAIHLVLNGLWSAVFFGMRRPDWALVEIVCLWLSIFATMVAFHGVNETAAYMLVPYACWVAFAVILNFCIWRLNPETPSRRQA